MKWTAVSFLFLLFSFAMSSATATTVTISDICSEIETTVPLLITDAKDVASATMKVSYDPSVIIVSDAGNSDFEEFTPNVLYAEEGWVKMAGYNILDGLSSGNVQFAELTITPKGNPGQSSELTIEVVTLADSEGNLIDYSVEHGSFTIGKSSDGSGSGNGGGSGGTKPSPTPTTSPTPSVNESPTPAASQIEESELVTVHVGDVTVRKGDSVNTTIVIKGVGGDGISAALINLTYNPDVVRVVNAENSEFDMFIPNIGDGKVRMIAHQTGAEGLKGDVKFAEILLEAVGDANESSELGLEVKELTDNAGFPVLFEIEYGYFSIEGVLLEIETGYFPVDGEEKAFKPIIPILGVVGAIAVIVALYFVIRQKRRK